ncbi:MAG: hypothetical protein NC085_09735, partial [Muribaculaceae bacterium]|nr:hypothetical protein [Muribaculaceae bacterium]
AYREEFEYCRNVPGLWAAYEELTPLMSDQSRWNADYWVELKKDLKKNFSIKRFEHMRQVAQVIFADKIKRIYDERRSTAEKPVSQPSDMPRQTNNSEDKQIEDAKKRIEEIKAREAAAAEERARKREEARKAEEERLRKIRENAEREIKTSAPSYSNTAQRGEPPKKTMGAGIALLAVLLLIAIIVAALLIVQAIPTP